MESESKAPEQKLALEINTQVERPKIAINGKLYSLKINSDFGLRDSAYLQQSGKRLSVLSARDAEISGEEATELSDLLDLVTKKVMIELPEDVFVLLTDSHKIAILNTFTEAAGLNEGQPQQE